MGFDTSRWFCPVFCAVAAIFFLGTTVLSSASGGTIFVSPDETANAFFAEQFAHADSLRVASPINSLFENALHPRSVLSLEGNLVPAAFLGLPVLYGMFVSIFGSWILLSLTPLIAILAALAFRKILRKLFSSLVCDLSAILFLFHPAVWYYSARGLMPNVLLVCLLIFSGYFFVARPCAVWVKFIRVDLLLAGLLLGLALFVRASEVYWIFLGLIVLAIAFWRACSWKDWMCFVLGIVIGLTPFFLFNAWTYGSPLLTGYTIHTSSGSIGVSNLIAQQTSLLLPFGFSLRAALKHFLQYGLGLFSWLSVLTMTGICVVWFKSKEKQLSKQRIYILLCVLVSLWLVIWYGSWTLFDNPDPTQITIANSYVRYWLPVYILTIPFIVEGLLTISSPLRKQTIFIVMVCLIVVGLNIDSVFFRGQDGIFSATQTLVTNKQIRSDILAQTAPDSVFIVDRSDKLFFPYRHVLYPFRSEKTYALMPALTKVAPLYYYGITFPTSDLTYLNTVKLKPLGLQIEFVKTYGVESLYHIYTP